MFEERALEQNRQQHYSYLKLVKIKAHIILFLALSPFVMDNFLLVRLCKERFGTSW